jgi:hypothetical protein
MNTHEDDHNGQTVRPAGAPQESQRSLAAMLAADANAIITGVVTGVTTGVVTAMAVSKIVKPPPTTDPGAKSG